MTHTGATADKKRMSQLESDSDFRSALKAFIALAETCAARSASEVSAAFMNFARGGFRMVDGVTFNVTPELRTAENIATRRAQEILGPRLGDEKDLSQALWKATVKAIAGEISDGERLKLTLSEVINSVNQTFCYIAPNHLFHLGDGVDEIDVGPVSICRTENIIDDLAISRPGEKWGLAVGEKPELLAGETVVFVRPKLSWKIQVRSSKNNLTEEATWHADVATSLLRMASVDFGPMIPKIGELEASPFGEAGLEDHMIAYSAAQMVTGGRKKLGYYEIAPTTAKPLRTWIKRTAPHIFSAQTGSLGEQLARGLGWLSRARRTGDRAERFLLFFTALEALISRQSANPQLTDYLARMTSVVWTNGAENRSKYYSTFKDLYDKRSKLVHRGIREISTRDVNTIQYVTEQIFFVVLDKVPLDQPLNAFHKGLETASFGGRWPGSPKVTA